MLDPRKISTLLSTKKVKIGRPPDKFCQDNVEVVSNNKDKKRWRCKHCKVEYSGTASRIRKHLAGLGTEIGHCEAVPSRIRKEASEREKASKKRGHCEAVPSSIPEEALQREKASKKRGRSLSLGDVNNGTCPATFQVPSFNGEVCAHTNKDFEQVCATDALVRFLVKRNLPFDVLEDPDFLTFLKRADQHGIPPWLLRDGRVGIRSVSNFENEVSEYIEMVKESWKTTGCTMIRYNMNEGRGNFLALKKKSFVYGFYSPKGLIFVERQQLDFSKGFEDAFKKHALKLPIKDVTHEVRHYGHPCCEFSPGREFGRTKYIDGDEDSDDDDDDDDEDDDDYKGYDPNDYLNVPCLQQRVEGLWMRIIKETGWVRNLIQKSEKMYQYMLFSSESYKCKGWRKLMVEKDANDMPMTSFTRLESIMVLKGPMKAWLKYDLQYYDHAKDLEEIINNDEFWCDGKNLLIALRPLMEIIDYVNTLVPTAGYLQLLLDRAKSRLKDCYNQEVSKYQLIWQTFYRFYLDLKNDWGVAAYFSPVYDLQAKGLHREQSICKASRIDEVVGRLVKKEDKNEKLDAEMAVYLENNPFANLPVWERKEIHPVELWNEYGAGFPLLKKCAIMLMSQPTSCMCNQLKKHIKDFKGEDNFILRLNYHMMQQFTLLGDRIYKPLERLEICYTDLDEVPARIPDQISPDKMVDGPHIGQIPAWMNRFISNSTDVIADGNCGYRAIAESLGLGQDQWHQVRRKLHLQSQNYAMVSTISEVLNCYGEGPSPLDTELDVTNMGLLVACTFKAIFVVLGPPNMCCTYLPLYFTLYDYPFWYVPEIVICHIPERSHFISLSMTKNAPLPPVCDPLSKSKDFADFLEERLNSYCMLLKSAEDPLMGEMPTMTKMDQMSNVKVPSLLMNMVVGPYIDQIPTWMNEFISKSTDVIADGNCGYRAIAESLGVGQDQWLEIKQKLYDEFTSQLSLYEPTIVHGNAFTISKALNYKELGFAPLETWLEVTDMGLLVASAFQAIFVVLGPSIRCTYLPLYLPDGCQLSSVPEIAICLIPKRSHFISISLTKNAPLPPVYNMWFSHHHTNGLDPFLADRLKSYNEKELARNKYVGNAAS